MQVEVTDIGSELTRACQTNQSIEVGPIDVDLSPVFVHHRAHRGHGVFVHAVR